MLVCTVLGAVFAATGAVGTVVTTPLVDLLRAAATALFIAAGVLQVARWRIDGDPLGGLAGTILLMYGGVALPLTSIAGAMSADRPESLFPALVRWLTTGVVLVTAARLLTLSQPVVPRSRLVEVSARTMTVAVGGFFVLLFVHLHWPSLLDGNRTVYLLLAGSLAAGWLSLGAYAVLRGHHATLPGGGDAVRMAPVLTSMSVAELLRMPGLTVWTASAALLVVSIGVLSVGAALQRLVTAVNHDHDDVEVLSSALAQAREAVSVQTEWREELTHDARNVLAGLRATIETLEKYSPHLDATSLGRLRMAAIDELGHLEHMITSPSGDGDARDFDVADVVGAVVDLRRAAGLEVALDCPGGRAFGRPTDLARVLQNLLVNAQQHGRGAGVRVRVHTTGDQVEIQVSDHGPGLPTDIDPFDRGMRGSGSLGSGLGLFVSRTLMHDAGGDLVAENTPSGASFCVRLPRSGDQPASRVVALRPLPALHRLTGAEAQVR